MNRTSLFLSVCVRASNQHSCACLDQSAAVPTAADDSTTSSPSIKAGMHACMRERERESTYIHIYTYIHACMYMYVCIHT
jgi:hypothetical protein